MNKDEELRGYIFYLVCCVKEDVRISVPINEVVENIKSIMNKTEWVSVALYSYHDTKGKLFIDCSECNRGGNGLDKDKCACGWRVTTGDKGGCFMGDLLESLQPPNDKVKGE